MKLITKKRLLEMGFVKIEGPAKGRSLYRSDFISVQLNKGEPENPEIFIEDSTTGGTICFPGAYTLKDLKDLMFFYYGEEEYSKVSDGWPVEILKVKKKD